MAKNAKTKISKKDQRDCEDMLSDIFTALSDHKEMELVLENRFEPASIVVQTMLMSRLSEKLESELALMVVLKALELDTVDFMRSTDMQIDDQAMTDLLNKMEDVMGDDLPLRLSLALESLNP